MLRSYLVILSVLVAGLMPPAVTTSQPWPTLTGSALIPAWHAQAPDITSGGPSATQGESSSSTVSGAAAATGAYNGGRILFVSYRGGASQIYAMEPDGSNQVNLSANEVNDSAPAMASDGRIAFISIRDGNQELYVMDEDGGNQRRLTSTAGDEGFPVWSPDDSSLVFQYHEGDRWQLVTIKPDGTQRNVLAEDSAELGQPDWSPIGGQIAFYWNNRTAPGIYLIPPTGGTPVYTNIGYQFPRWSPDGTKLAFVYLALGGTYGRVGVANSDGSGSTTWVSPGEAQDSHPRWSPDGRKLAFDSTYSGYQQLYVTRSDGSTAGNYLNLSASLATDWMPAWSRRGVASPAVSGPYVAYQSGSVGEPARIHLYNSETTEDTIIVEAEELRLAGLWGPWVVYQQGNSYGSYDVWAYDREAGQARRLSSTSQSAVQNRPFIDGSRVIWRQTSANAYTISGRFYAYNLLTQMTTPLAIGASAPYYSRYAAGAGRLAFIDESGQVRLYDLNAGSMSTLGQRPALLAGISEDYVAALERSAGGNDLLATYVIGSGTRTEIAQGTDGLAALSGDTLAWRANGALLRQDLVEDGEPQVIAGSVQTFAASWDLVVWLDGYGAWNPAQGHATPVFGGIEDVAGDVELTVPEDEPGGLAATAAGDWRDRWLARITSGTLCRVNRISYPGQPPRCSTISPGQYAYPGDELYTRPTDRATLLFRDGSTLNLRGGNYLRIVPHRPTAERMIRDIIENTFDTVTIARLQQAVEEYRQDGELKSLDLGQLGNDLTVIGGLSEKLAKQLAQGRQSYLARGFTKLPAYFSVMEDTLDFSRASAKRLGGTLNVFQVLMSTQRVLNLDRYVDQLDRAFMDYFITISRAVKQPDGSILYVPLDPASAQYLNSNDVFFKMVLHDSRTCFNERNWQARFLTDGTLLFSSPGCQTVSWSKSEIARHIAAADREVLRRAFLAPLLSNSLRWYQDLSGVLVPGEATLILSLLTSNQSIQRLEVKQGHIQYVQDIDRARRRAPTAFRLAGVRVLIWGTAFEATVADDGSGSLFAQDSMPVLAGDNDSVAPRAITWQEGNIAWDASGSTTIPDRSGWDAPLLVELTPNEDTIVSADVFSIHLRFSQPMSPTAVTDNGRLTLAGAGGAAILDGSLGSLPHSWDTLNTTLTLTPTIPLAAGEYALSVTLPGSVVSESGQSVAGSPFATAFTISSAVGAAGGRLESPTGVRVEIPPGALSVPEQVSVVPIRISETPEGWVPETGLAYEFGPSGLSFALPVTLTLPLDGGGAGTAIMHRTTTGWVALDGQVNDGNSIQAPTMHFSEYAVFRPVTLPVTYSVFLPLSMR